VDTVRNYVEGEITFAMPIGLMTIINTTQDHCEAVWSYFYRCWWSYGL